MNGARCEVKRGGDKGTRTGMKAQERERKAVWCVRESCISVQRDREKDRQVRIVAVAVLCYLMY